MKTFLIDRSQYQPFQEVGLQKEYSTACVELGFEPTVTSPTGMEEYKDGGTLVGVSSGTEDWNVVEVSGTYTKGEDEALEFAKMNENTWIGISDQPAQKKFWREGIRTLDHIEDLYLMVTIGVISCDRAAGIYRAWANGTNVPKTYPKDFRRCWTELSVSSIMKEKTRLLQINE